MQKKLCIGFFLFLWKYSTLADACGSKSGPFRQKSEPVKVLYSQPGPLNVVLELQNVPRHVTGYEIYKKKRNEQLFEEVMLGNNTGANGGNLILPFNEYLEISNSHTIYKVLLKANGVYCNRNLNGEFLQIVYTEKKQSGNLHCKITVDWNNECQNTVPVRHATTEDLIYLKVSPEDFRDVGQSVAEFHCHAYCQRDEALVWFQDKGLPDYTVLLVNHTYNEHLARGRISRKITLKKTLEDADRNTSILCGVRTIVTGKEHEKLNLAVPFYATKGVTSKRISIILNRKINTDKPTVTVDQCCDVIFPQDSAMEFVCRSTVVDGRILSWYEEDPNSVPRHLESTKVLNGTGMTSTLKLDVNESFVSKIIYCTQEYRFVYRNGEIVHNYGYGEIARSEPIRLRRQESVCEDTRSRKLMIAAACVVGAVLLLLAGVLASRRWRRHAQEEDGDYVVPQITYAVLALPETDSKPPNKPEKQNYVEIVGVYKNKTKVK